MGQFVVGSCLRSLDQSSILLSIRACVRSFIRGWLIDPKLFGAFVVY